MFRVYKYTMHESLLKQLVDIGRKVNSEVLDNKNNRVGQIKKVP
jgi:rRNA processing protein Gar1